MNWIIGTVVLAVISFIGFTYYSSQKLEKPNYEVLVNEGDYQIRLYNSSLWADVEVSTTNQGDMSREGFRPLANYIFGGNAENKSLSMTAPVAMVNDSINPSMRFYMPSDRNIKNLPKPNENNIRFVELPERKLATFKFGGSLNEGSKKEAMKKLKIWCEENNLEIIGPMEVFGYNAPYEVIKTNEVAFPIKD